MVIKIWFTALVIQKNMTNSSVIQKIILLTTAVAFPYFFPIIQLPKQQIVIPQSI
jgi:hypothetical protein